MVKTIVIWVFIAAVIIFFIVWALTGGIGRAISAGKTLMSPSEWFSGNAANATGTSFTLPWQTDIQPATVDTGETNFNSSVSTDAQSQVDDLNSQYDQLKSQAERAKLFGTPSPYVGKIMFVSNTAGESDPVQEYVQIQNTSAGDIPLSGWSLQSVYINGRFLLPNAASPLITGALNKVEPVTLKPGAFADITSSPSPVGVSFRENMCTGYLAQFQPFSPPLNSNCPDPGAALPVTDETLRTFGDTCIDYVRTIPQCHFVTNAELPQSLTPACRAFVGNTFSYNGCVSAHSADLDFNTDVWRMYLGSKTELWRNTHDIVRLLDETGRTVDVLTY